MRGNRLSPAVKKRRMAFRQQLDAMRSYALMLRDFNGTRGLSLYAVCYPGKAPRVSVIGHAISYGALDVWHHQGGARLHKLAEVDAL